MRQSATGAAAGQAGCPRQPSPAEMQARIEALEAELRLAGERAGALRTELDEARQQQTATAEVLGVINSSPGNLAPVFNTMLARATDLCAATFGILWTFDGQHYHAAAFQNVPPRYVEFLRDPPPAT